MPVFPGAFEPLLSLVPKATCRLLDTGYTRSAYAHFYSSGNSFIRMPTTGQRDGFRAAGSDPSRSSSRTVTKVWGTKGAEGLFARFGRDYITSCFGIGLGRFRLPKPGGPPRTRVIVNFFFRPPSSNHRSTSRVTARTPNSLQNSGLGHKHGVADIPDSPCRIRFYEL